MSRQLLVTGMVLVSLLGGASACSGSDDKPGPKPTASKSATAAPAPKPQPKGADGVTYEIQNWDEYADDPAVLAYKQAAEALSASVNKREPVAGIKDIVTKPVLRLLVGNLVSVKKSNWHVQDVAHIRVQSAHTRGSQASVITCEWAPSTDLYDRNDKLVGDVKREWRRYSAKLTLKSGTWVLSPLKQIGTCPGGAPA